jgi:hypothetical protein
VWLAAGAVARLDACAEANRVQSQPAQTAVWLAAGAVRGYITVIPVKRASRDSLESAPCSSECVAPKSAVRLAAADGAAMTTSRG